jgi:hypothetical protein
MILLVYFRASGLLFAISSQIHHLMNSLMKTKYLLLVCLCWLYAYSSTAQNPPYSGTIFINPNIITPDDPSTLESTTYVGQGERELYDRRVKNG